MLQLLPALILLLLQSQSHGNRLLSDQGSERFLRAVYCQELEGPDLALAEQLRGWIQAIDSNGSTNSKTIIAESIVELKLGKSREPLPSRLTAVFASSGRLRDGPALIA